jgi:hexokinase
MNVTWVLGWPDGHEEGQYLTVDLGGTNLRVCWIELTQRHGDINITQDEYKLPDEIKTGGAEDLFDFIADSLQRFISNHDLKGTKEEPLHLGFTFSYPAHQDYIDHGKLITWTKGFEISGVEGEDAAALLRDAMTKKVSILLETLNLMLIKLQDLPIELVALINDTTGAMIASAYNDPETIVGVIFGTGCNGAYMENVGSIPKLDTDLHGDTPMAINCEYGAFDNSHQVLPRTKYDIHIDDESPKPGEQAFEKMSAGLYLGEIYRLVVLELYDRNIIFTGQNASKLRSPYILDTGFLSTIENDLSPAMSETRRVFKETLGFEARPEELIFSQRLAEAIAVRGARLCTCGIAAICRKKAIKSGHVAADGSVANKHPTFKKRWANAMGEVLDWTKHRTADPISITSAEDGSGVGAAVIAAMTLRRAREGNMAGIKGK